MDQDAGKMRFDRTTMGLDANSVIAFEKTRFTITCLDGIIWVTGPNGFEHTLAVGQSISGAADGKVCIQALSQSEIRIDHRRMQGFCHRLYWKIMGKMQKNSHYRSRHRFEGVSNGSKPFVLYPS